jgi:hypothetical protein
MTFLLPLVAFALAIAAPFLLRTERGRVEIARVGALLALLAVSAVIVFRSEPEVDRMPALVGLALGAAACVLGAWGGGLAFGVAAASALHLLPASSLPVVGLALVAGTGLGALTVGGEVAALAAVLVVAADNLGMRHSPVPAAAFVGSQAGVALAVGALLVVRIKELVFIRPILVGVLVSLAGLFVFREDGNGLLYCLALGALGGVVLDLLVSDKASESSRVGLAAIIGVGLATAAFGLGKGVGLALATLAAVGVLLAVENRRAVLALGPLVGLTLYRVLREAGTGATRALEINQNYTILALLIGLALPLMPTDWLTGRVRTARVASSFLWGIVAIAAAPLVLTAFGMRGGVGFVVGLGISGLVQAFRAPSSFLRGARVAKDDYVDREGNEEGVGGGDKTTLLPLALGAGLSGATILALGWIGAESAFSRDDKIHLFGYAATGIAVIAILLALLGRPTKTEVIE